MSTFRQFLSDKSGNFSLLTAFLIVPLIMVAGGAIDLAIGYDLKQRLSAAADAAALAAIAEQSPGVVFATAKKISGRVPLAEDIARRVFMGNVSSIATKDQITFNPVVTRNGSIFTASMQFSMTVSTNFMRIVGVNSFEVSGLASAKFDTSTYQNLYLLIDNSPSMGIAASVPEMIRMREATISATDPEGCAFACHYTDTNDNPLPRNFIDVARSLGIRLRIDLVSDAVAALMDTAKASRRFPDQFAFAIYSFGPDSNNIGLTKIQEMSRDYDRLKAAARRVDLMQIKGENMMHMATDLETNLQKIAREFPPQGAGKSPLDPENILFLISDGLTDISRTSCNYPVTTAPFDRCMQPVEETICDQIKNQDVKIAVLYTTYRPPYKGNAWGVLDPLKAAIAPAMEACASPGLFFEVSSADEISEAMKALFFRAIQAPILTQ